MKVICIDASPSFAGNGSCPLEEGVIYDVIQCETQELAYDVVNPIVLNGAHKKRFIPLSSQDETETEVYKNLQTQTA